jgi:cytochrome c oxidase subunit 2
MGRKIVVAGLVSILSSAEALLLFAAATHGLDESKVQKIEISASKFAFSPNEITVKKGQPVELDIHSTDANHGLAIEEWGIRIEIPKGKTVVVTFVPKEVGTFEGKCAHFCGKGHGSMKLTVHVVE